MRMLYIFYQKDKFVEATAMADRARMFRLCSQPQLRYQLIDEDNKANSADETSQEGSGEHTVEKPKTSNAGNEYDCAGHARHNSSDPGMHHTILVPSRPFVDGCTDDLTHKERASSFRANYHLRAAA